MAVTPVDSTPPPKSADTARVERPTERRREATEHDAQRQVERGERAEARGRRLDVKA